MIDLSYIDVGDMLRALDIKNVTLSAGEASFSCPSKAHFHGDQRPSARMNIHTTAFICYGCGWRGNAISFLSKHKEISKSKAKRVLEERYGGGLTAPIEDLTAEVEAIMADDEPEVPRRVPAAEWLKAFNIDWKDLSAPYPPYEYMKSRGFDASYLEAWELGFDPYTDRITIPIRDVYGNLIGFKGRKINEDDPYPKYMILGDSRGTNRFGFDPYHKSEIVFGLDKFREKHDEYPAPSVVIVEGELNVIAMDQKGFDAVGVAGSEFSQTQCELINKYCDSVIVYFDNDPAGWKGTRKVIEMISSLVEVRAVLNAPGDAAELSPDKIKDLVARAEPALLLATRGDLG